MARYFLFELPSNLVIRQLGAANWLAFIIVCWGAVTIGMGFVPTWQALALCRALLGIFEVPTRLDTIKIDVGRRDFSQDVSISSVAGISATKCKPASHSFICPVSLSLGSRYHPLVRGLINLRGS